jgi:hypothetical protein
METLERFLPPIRASIHVAHEQRLEERFNSLLVLGQYGLVNHATQAIDEAFAFHAGSFKLSVAVGVVSN